MKRDERSCPQCGETIPKAAHLCKYCGKRFELPNRAETQSAPDGPRPVITKRALGWFAAMLGGAVILSNVLPRHVSSPPPKAETETSSFADVGKQNAWIAASQISIKGRLKDPGSAEFRNVHFYSGGKTAVACGEVNAKNSFGG